MVLSSKVLRPFSIERNLNRRSCLKSAFLMSKFLAIRLLNCGFEICECDRESRLILSRLGSCRLRERLATLRISLKPRFLKSKLRFLRSKLRLSFRNRDCLSEIAVASSKLRLFVRNCDYSSEIAIVCSKLQLVVPNCDHLSEIAIASTEIHIPH